MVNLKIDFNGLKLDNPVLTASGTFGYGEEFADFVDLERLGGFIVKGTTLYPRLGNNTPRMAETAMGMLNAVGLQNKGVEVFCNDIYPRIRKYKTNILVNVSGTTIEEYISCAEQINALDDIPGIELNISCPNVKKGGMTFGTSLASAQTVVKEVRKVYHKHMMVKLSPNVTDITEIARGVEDEGADSISLINTLLGIAIDANTRKPKLATITGGLSGPAVKPVALRMVWQVSNAVKIPVCGLGGIMNAEDAIEFILAGASCIQLGTANFIDPAISIKVLEGITAYCEFNGINDINDLIGGLITN